MGVSDDDDRSSVSIPSDIDENEQLSKEVLDGMSDEENQDFGTTTPSEDMQTDVQSNEIIAGDLHVTESDPEKCLRTESKNGYVGNDATPDRAASGRKESEDGEGKGATSITDDVPMVLDPTITDTEAQVNDEVLRSKSDNVPTSIRTGVRSEDETQSGDHPRNSGKPGHAVVQDREWVLLAAVILMKNGKGKEWAEIVDTWVRLQRSWEKIEVSPISTRTSSNNSL